MTAGRRMGLLGALSAGGLILGGLAFAFDYRLGGGEGPEGLEARIARAAERWLSVEGGEVEANETPDAPNIVGYGDGTAFGPDTYSLTLQRAPEGTTEVLLNPTDLNDRALTHELGLLAGLRPAPLTDSVMNPSIPPEAGPELSPADEAALRALITFPPEDINQDGVVDFYDLAELGAAFGETGVNVPADIDRSGVVDRADVERLRAAYTFGSPAETDPAETTAGEVPAVGEGAGGMTGGAMTGGMMTGGMMTGGMMTGGATPRAPMTGGASPQEDAEPGDGL